MLVGEVSPMTEKPTLADGAPLKKSGLESALMWFVIGGWRATPAGHSYTRARVVVGATGSRHALGLKARPLMADGVPLLCDDKSAIMIFRSFEKLRMSERKTVERCVCGECLKKEGKVGNSASLQNVEHNGIDVGGNHVNHF